MTLNDYPKLGIVCPMPVERDAVYRLLTMGSLGGDKTQPARLDADVVTQPAIESIDRDTQETYLCCSGIGKVNAAMATTRLLVCHQVDLVCIIGVAGHLGGLTPGAWLIDSAFQHDYGSSGIDGMTTYTVGDVPIGPATVNATESSVAMALIAKNPSMRHARVASGDVFLQDPNRSHQLHSVYGAHLVDMETAAVAQVAMQFGKPWLGVRAISDDANSDSSDDIMANVKRASDEAAVFFGDLFVP